MNAGVEGLSVGSEPGIDCRLLVDAQDLRHNNLNQPALLMVALAYLVSSVVGAGIGPRLGYKKLQQHIGFSFRELLWRENIAKQRDLRWIFLSDFLAG